MALKTDPKPEHILGVCSLSYCRQAEGLDGWMPVHSEASVWKHPDNAKHNNENSKQLGAAVAVAVALGAARTLGTMGKARGGVPGRQLC